MGRRAFSTVTIVLVAALLTACDAAGDATGDAPSTSTAPAGRTIPGPPAPPTVVAGNANGIRLHSWAPTPDRDGLVYAGSDDGRGIFVRRVDAGGETATLIPGPMNDPRLAFDTSGELLLVVDRRRSDGSDPGYRLSTVRTEGGDLVPIAASRNPIVAGDTWEAEVVFAVEARRRTMFYAHDSTTREVRELGELANRDGGVQQLIAVDGHAVAVYDSGRDTRVVSLPLAGGDPVELPAALKSSSYVLLGGTADGGVVISQTGEGEDSIYVTDPAGKHDLRILADGVRPDSISRHRDTILYRAGDYDAFRISLDTGVVTPDPQGDLDPSQLEDPIAGLDMRYVAFRETLPDGRWLVTGAESEGPEVDYWWEMLHDGSSELRSIKLEYLFVYDPRSGELTRLSGEPETNTTTTLTGTGSLPDRIMTIEVLDGGRHVAFSTGFAGPIEVEYNLYIVAIPEAG